MPLPFLIGAGVFLAKAAVVAAAAGTAFAVAGTVTHYTVLSYLTKQRIMDDARAKGAVTAKIKMYRKNDGVSIVKAGLYDNNENEFYEECYHADEVASDIYDGQRLYV